MKGWGLLFPAGGAERVSLRPYNTLLRERLYTMRWFVPYSSSSLRALVVEDFGVVSRGSPLPACRREGGEGREKGDFFILHVVPLSLVHTAYTHFCGGLFFTVQYLFLSGHGEVYRKRTREIGCCELDFDLGWCFRGRGLRLAYLWV